MARARHSQNSSGRWAPSTRGFDSTRLGQVEGGCVVAARVEPTPTSSAIAPRSSPKHIPLLMASSTAGIGPRALNRTALGVVLAGTSSSLSVVRLSHRQAHLVERQVLATADRERQRDDLEVRDHRHPSSISSNRSCESVMTCVKTSSMRLMELFGSLRPARPSVSASAPSTE